MINSRPPVQDSLPGFKPVLAGYFRALIVAALLTAATGLVTSVSALSEMHNPLMSQLIFLVSIFYGAAVAAKKAGGKGLYMGLAVSLLFLLTTMLLSGILFTGTFALVGLVKKALLGLAAGIVGGMFGLAFS